MPFVSKYLLDDFPAYNQQKEVKGGEIKLSRDSECSDQ